MDTNSRVRIVSDEGSSPASAEQRLKELGIKLPAPPEPFGTYVEAVQTDNLLFLTGMLPTEGRRAKFTMDPRLDGSLGYCNEVDLNHRTNGGEDGKVHEGGQD